MTFLLLYMSKTHTCQLVIQPCGFQRKPDLMLGVQNGDGNRGGNPQSVEGLEGLGHCQLVEGIRLL